MDAHVRRLKARQAKYVNRLKDIPDQMYVSPNDFEEFIKDLRRLGLPIFTEHGFVTLRARPKKGSRK